MELFAPKLLKDEITSNQSIILDKIQMDKDKFLVLLNLLMKIITFLPQDKIDQCEDEAFKLIGQRDTKDAVYLAAVLCSDADGIWSNDDDFSVVDELVYSTSDLLKYYNLNL